MKRLIINLLALIALLTVGVMHLSAITYAQDGPPTLVDPFATTDTTTVDDAADDAPPTLTLAPPTEEPPAEEPPAEEPPVEEAAPAEEAPVHAAAPAANAYSGGTTAKSGPGLAVIGLGSLIGAAALRRRKK